VGRLVGMPGTTIGQWARRGYIRSSQSAGEPRVYSYQDIAEAMVVRELLDAGVPHREIGEAIAVLRAEHGDWPLSSAELLHDGRGVVVARDGDHYDLTGRRWHRVLDLETLERIVNDLERGGWVVRELADLRHVEVNPDRLSGRPTVRGRRISVEDVADLAARAGGREALRTDYDLDEREIDDALRWTRAIRAGRAR
jgi:uncharacterized protein (DUF433 family)/DNA-binding transcriptional MerR regulator